MDNKVEEITIFYLGHFCFYFPRSTNTESVNARKRTYTVPYTTVYRLYTLRIRPYFSVLPGSVLRSYIPGSVYGEIRSETEVVYGAYFPVYDRLFYCIRPYTVVFLRIINSSSLVLTAPLLCRELQRVIHRSKFPTKAAKYHYQPPPVPPVSL
jgi:hypothetical protein